MVSAGEIYNNLKTLLNNVYALKSHKHGNITNDGEMNIANGIVTTNSNKEVVVSSAISKNKINDFPTIGAGLSTNDFNNEYKDKLNALSTYQIRLTDERTWGLRANDDPHTLTVLKSLPKHAIYCLVTKNKTEVITEGQIVFIVNGKTYLRDIDEGGFAELNINLNAEEVDLSEYISTGNIVTNPIVYTVIAVYRPGDEWTEAIDVKQMIVYD